MKLVKILLSISLIAVLLCACTNAEDNSSKGNENPAVSDNTPQSSTDDLLNSFISSKDYVKYTTAEHQLSYIITDLNADGVNELLMQSEDELDFHYMWIFAVHNNDVSLVLEHYGYGSFRYSPSQNAVIVPPEFRPFIGASRYSFYTLDQNKLEPKFTVGADPVDGDNTAEQYFYWTNENEKEITKDELSSYFTDAVSFNWIKIDNE